MAGLKSAFDTMILIDSLNGVRAARLEIGLIKPPDRLISVVTKIEVLVGMKPADESAMRKFLATFTIVAITEDIVERAAELRRTSRLKLPDAVILATAQANHVQLVTRNTRDFAASDPRIRVPYIL